MSPTENVIHHNGSRLFVYVGTLSSHEGNKRFRESAAISLIEKDYSYKYNPTSGSGYGIGIRLYSKEGYYKFTIFYLNTNINAQMQAHACTRMRTHLHQDVHTHARVLTHPYVHLCIARMHICVFI